MIKSLLNVRCPRLLTRPARLLIYLLFAGSHDNRNDDIVDPTHKGPVQVYVAPTSSNGAGAVWVKLFSEGFTNDWVSLIIQLP